MLNKLKKSNNEGFTIIEVMIVLAIVGLIILIVFLAVPALQRNSRNTQRKNDASSVAAAVSTYVTNNNGKLPASLGNSTTLLDICASAGNANNSVTPCSGNTESAKVGYYDVSAKNFYLGLNTTAGFTVPTPAAISATAASAAIISRDQALIITKANCTLTGGKYTYTPRGSIVLYVTESASGNGSLQCIEA